MEKRLCVVTGGSRGIGRAICEMLLKEGHKVVFIATNDEKAAAFIEESGSDRLFYYHCDVAQPQEIESCCRKIKERFGTVSVLVNNAGIQTHVPFLEMSPECWMQTMDINLNSAFYFCKAFAPGMVEQNWGRIVNIASMSARRGSNKHVHYCASKAGLVGMTRALSLEIAQHGVTVNAVCPGIVDTDIVQETLAVKREIWLKEMHVKRLGQPEDIANAVKYLVSEEASWVSGQALDVNGGILTP